MTILLIVFVFINMSCYATGMRIAVRDNDLYDNEVEEYADLIATQDDKKQSKQQKRDAELNVGACSKYDQNDQM